MWFKNLRSLLFTIHGDIPLGCGLSSVLSKNILYIYTFHNLVGNLLEPQEPRLAGRTMACTRPFCNGLAESKFIIYDFRKSLDGS